MSIRPDIDPQETQEWLEALEAVLENEGVDRAHYLIECMVDKARRSGAYLPYSANTAYVNTIPVTKQKRFPGDRAMERRIRSFIRWNAMAMAFQRMKERIRRSMARSPGKRFCLVTGMVFT